MKNNNMQIFIDPSNEDPSNEDPSNGEPSNGEPSNEESSNEESSNGEPFEESSNGEPSNEESLNEESSNGEPLNGEPSNGEPSNGEPSNGELSNINQLSGVEQLNNEPSLDEQYDSESSSNLDDEMQIIVLLSKIQCQSYSLTIDDIVCICNYYTYEDDNDDTATDIHKLNEIVKSIKNGVSWKYSRVKIFMDNISKFSHRIDDFINIDELFNKIPEMLMKKWLDSQITKLEDITDFDPFLYNIIGYVGQCIYDDSDEMFNIQLITEYIEDLFLKIKKVSKHIVNNKHVIFDMMMTICAFCNLDVVVSNFGAIELIFENIFILDKYLSQIEDFDNLIIYITTALLYQNKNYEKHYKTIILEKSDKYWFNFLKIQIGTQKDICIYKYCISLNKPIFNMFKCLSCRCKPICLPEFNFCMLDNLTSNEIIKCKICSENTKKIFLNCCPNSYCYECFYNICKKSGRRCPFCRADIKYFDIREC